VSVTRYTARLDVLLAAVPLALACGLVLSGCKSSPSKPDPDPGQGRVVLLGNDSFFDISVGAGHDCRESRRIEPADTDFSPVHLDYELSCSAEAQGEGHSGNMAVMGGVIWTLDGPDNSLSEVSVVMEAVGNRSRTGLASSGAVLRPRFRFEVTGVPVAYRASGSINYVDSFPDFFLLRRVGAAQGSELISKYGQGHGEAGSLSLDESGTLSEGAYEVWVELYTTDWFTEDLTFVLRFGAVE
ncbi:MAG: hypothetical protein ACSLFL_08545, partial [Alphaproteobacteria bacterium]